MRFCSRARCVGATLFLLLLSFLPGLAAAQSTLCASLEGEEREAADALLARLNGYGPCTEPLAKCLAQERVSVQTVRQANSICRALQLGESAEVVEKGFVERRKSMSAFGPKALPAKVSLEGYQAAGGAEAPVTAVLYVCSRCPYCRDVTLRLHDEVERGDLKGKVRLFLKPFPLKGHEGALEGGLALAASARMGAQWPYTLFLYRHFNEFHPSVLADWSSSAGLSKEEFEKRLAEPETRRMLEESKKEGVRMRLEATPTLLIDGQRYSGSLDAAGFVDVLLERYEAVRAERSAAAK